MTLHGDVQVAVRPAVDARLALACQADLRAVIHAARDADDLLAPCCAPGPRPWQVWQGVAMVSPCPPQVGQVPTWTIEPRMVWRTWRTSPVPLQVAQRTGEVPGSAPLPLQVVQSSSRVISISFSTPKTASSKVRSRRYCRSAPRRGALRDRRLLRPNPAKAEQVAEDIGKIGEIDRVKSGAPPGAFHPGMTEAVVSRPLLRVGEHGVGLVDFLEALFRVRLPC